MKRWKHSITAFSVFFTLRSVAQVDPAKDDAVSRLVEAVAVGAEENMDHTALVESLYEAYEAPVDLNSAGREQLEALVFLSDIQIDALAEYIRKHGPLLSVYELQLIPGWDEETVFLLAPFVRVVKDASREKWKWKNVFRSGKHEMVLRYSQLLETQKGFEVSDSLASRYLGDPSQIFLRYRFSYRDKVSCGLTARKDRGEEFFGASQPAGFDYYGAHIFIRDYGPFRSIALGDYLAQFGQGLTFWKGGGMGKTATGTNLRKFAGGLKPYSGTSPFLANRGAGVTATLDRVHVTGFFSWKFVDGSVASDSLSEEMSSLDATGYHRTESELAKRNSATELIAGGNVRYKALKWNAGLTGVYTRYSAELQPGNAPYELYDFSGRSLWNIGADYNLLWGKVYLFGELAVSGNGGYAFLQGLQASLHPRLSVGLLFREYAKNYQNPHAAAFGENGSNRNERGLYLSFDCIPARKLRLNFNLDVFRFPWLRFNVDAPSWGTETTAQLAFLPSGRTELLFRAGYGLRQENSLQENIYTSPLADVHRLAFRMGITHEVRPGFRLRSRVEGVIISRDDHPGRTVRWGCVAYQDVMWQLPWIPLNVAARIAFFRTDDFDTRIYAYESDVLYSFSVPAYYDTGMRFYFNLNYDVLRGLSVWFRIAQTYYANAVTLGSGLDEIQGNTRTEISAQVRYAFGRKRKK